jgi:hypothetical protein
MKNEIVRVVRESGALDFDAAMPLGSFAGPVPRVGDRVTFYPRVKLPRRPSPLPVIGTVVRVEWSVREEDPRACGAVDSAAEVFVEVEP